jgi:hypothetical protein
MEDEGLGLSTEAQSHKELFNFVAKRVCEKGKNWCPFVLSRSKDEWTRIVV